MLAVTGISRHGFFCYQTSVPLNKFVCKLYNVGGVPLHLIPPNCVIILYIKHHNTEVYHVRKF